MISKVALGARIVLGLIFFIFGLNGFFQFLPMNPPPMSETASNFMMALMKTGYMFPLIKGIEVFCGVLLLSNVLVPFALILLAPIVVNITAVHFILLKNGYLMVIGILALMFFLAWTKREVYRPLFKIK